MSRQRTKDTGGDPIAGYAEMVARRRPWLRNTVQRGTIEFDQFRQIVRRYPPSELLPTLARLSIASGEPPFTDAALATAPPWATALIARESALWGNEHRQGEVTADAIRILMNAHNNIREGEERPETAQEVGDSLLDIMIRIAYEQFPYQESIFEEVSRSHALMVEGATEIDVEVLNDNAWHEFLGAPLGEVVGATFFLQVAANENQGWFDHTWLDRDDMQELFQRWPREVIEHRAEQLSSTFEEFKDAYEAEPHPPVGYERYAYNPLVDRPFLKMPDGRLLAPQPKLILRTVSPGALYYDAIRHFDQPFGRDLGHLTGHYVGKQLRSIEPTADVEPEFKYKQGKQTLDSTDWFLILPSLVVLIEVKSARFGLLERAAFGEYRDKVKGLLNKAASQLQKSSEAMDGGVPEFAHIPTNRPRIGIIVTGEPLYMTNTHWVRDLLDEATFPTLTASLREIESLCSLPRDEIESQLISIMNDPDRPTWALGNALHNEPGTHRNLILERAWNAYPWPDALEDDEDQGNQP